jgi:apolipoprotein N-acyltransferase
MIDVEAYIVFLAACFFTLIYVLTKFSGKPANWIGIFGGISWFTLGFLWLFLAFEPPSYSSYSVALLFNGFGIAMIVYIVLDLFQPLTEKNRRRLEDDTD